MLKYANFGKTTWWHAEIILMWWRLAYWAQGYDYRGSISVSDKTTCFLSSIRITYGKLEFTDDLIDEHSSASTAVIVDNMTS